MKQKYKRDELLDLPRAGPTECARLFGWSSGSTFKRHLGDLPPIRKVALISGVYYVLQDVFRALYPELDGRRLKAKLAEYLEQRETQQPQRKPIDWIGPTEAARIMGYLSPGAFKRRLAKLPKIRSKKTRRGRYYDLSSVFAAIYSEATRERLNEMIIQYKQRRGQERLHSARRKGNESQKE